MKSTENCAHDKSRSSEEPDEGKSHVRFGTGGGRGDSPPNPNSITTHDAYSLQTSIYQEILVVMAC